jgi:hypothetical protein
MGLAESERAYRRILLLMAVAILFSYLLIIFLYVFAPTAGEGNLRNDVSFLAVTVGGLASLGILVYQVVKSNSPSPVEILTPKEREEIRERIKEELTNELEGNFDMDSLVIDREEELEKRADLVGKLLRVDEKGEVYLTQEKELTEPQKILLYLLGREYCYELGKIDSPMTSKNEITNKFGYKDIDWAYALNEIREEEESRSFEFIQEVGENSYRFDATYVENALRWIADESTIDVDLED